jgi:hypothetical protein
LRFRMMHRKGEFTMKKLLALFIIGGLLGTITGCPPATSTSGPKKSETKIEQRKTGSGESKREEKRGPGLEMKTEEKKTDEKKSGTDTKPSTTKTEEKKTEERKK